MYRISMHGMKGGVLIILLLALSTDFFAQPARRGGQDKQLKVIGKILDSNTQNPLEFATISVYSKLDSSLIGGGISELGGGFEMSIPIQPCYAVIEYISFQSVVIDPLIMRDKIDRQRNTLMIGDISLSQDAALLDEVEIRAEKSETQYSLDKKIFNVGQDLANRGGTAQDILDNVPSLSVDLEGNVSMRGSEGVKILIDGRPSAMVGVDNTNGLRAIPANMIDRVEVITNPSARYGAEGMVGILNIILKKDKAGGFNGSFDFSTGYPLRGGIGANVNYRKGKVNWFANYGLNYQENVGGGFSNITQLQNSTKTIQHQTSDRDRSGLSNGIRLGIDYFPIDKISLTGAFFYRKSDEDNFATLTYHDYVDDLNNLININVRTDDEAENESALQYSLRYKQEFSSPKHVLDVSIQYQDDLESESSIFKEITTFNSENVNSDTDQRSSNEEGEKSWIFNADYIHPFGGKDNKVELGTRWSFRDIGNDYTVEELLNGNYVPLEGLTNEFLYNEDVIGVYGIYGRKVNKIGIQLGMRTEFSHVVTELLNTNELNDRNYTGFFPTAHLTYEISPKNSYQISYSRRIRRPRFWDLNPFFTFSDSRNTFSGNPNLDPEYTDSYELGNVLYFDKGSLSSSLFYRYTTDVIERVVTFNSDGTTNRIPQNLSTRHSYGLDVNTKMEALEWWDWDVNFVIFGFNTNGTNIDNSFNASDLAWTARITSNFDFWDSDLQLRLNYRGPRNSTQGLFKSLAMLNLAWSKDLTKNSTLTFSVNDVFNGRKRRYEIVNDNSTLDGEFQWRGRTLTLAYNYRINQKKRRRSQRGQNNGDEGNF